MDLKSDDAQDRRLQQTYARWLDRMAKACFAATLAALLIYFSGAVPAFVPLAELPALWGLPVARYLELTGSPAGWAWIRLLDKSDVASLFAIALFPAVSILCYLRALPVLVSDRDRAYALIAAAQVGVLLLAASGLLNSFAGGSP